MKDCLLGKKPGFGLIEVMFAIALIGIMAAIALPAFSRRQAGYERKRFVTGFNALLSEAQQVALEKGKLVRVFFNFTTRTITVQTVKDFYALEKEYESVALIYAENNFIWPESQEIENFFVNGIDEMNQHEVTTTLWFFIVPSGTAQQVIINIRDMHGTVSVDGKPYSLVINPLTAQCREYYEFQIPSA